MTFANLSALGVVAARVLPIGLLARVSARMATDCNSDMGSGVRAEPRVGTGCLARGLSPHDWDTVRRIGNGAAVVVAE